MTTANAITPKPDTWVLCDDSTKQYGRQLGPGLYEFKEQRLRQGQVQAIVNLADYSEERREWFAAIYYGSLAELVATCGAEWEWILAECIFENLSL